MKKLLALLLCAVLCLSLAACASNTATTTTTTAFTRQDATSTAGEGGSWVQKALAASNGGGEYKDPLQHTK